MAKKTAKKIAAKKPAAGKPTAKANTEENAVKHRPATRSQRKTPLPSSTSAITTGVTKISKATKNTKGLTATAQNAEWLQLIIHSLEEVQDNVRIIQENSASGCPCLLGPSTGARLQINASCTGAQQQSDISGVRNNDGDGPQADAATQTSPTQKSNTATQPSPTQVPHTATRTSPRLRSDAATHTSPRQKKYRAAPEQAPYLDYPQNVDDRIEKSPCDVWDELYNYWSIHRLLDPTGFVHVQSSHWTPTEDAIDAINSVTEAITRQGGEDFTLWTRQAFTAWRTKQSLKVPINAEEYQFASRNPQDRLLVPFWIPLLNGKAIKGQACKALYHGDETEAWGHTVLLEILPGSGGEEHGFTIRIYDSAKENFFQRHGDIYAGEIGNLLSIGLWGSYNRWEIWGCAKQEGSSVCTIHAILNGWSRALNLRLNVKFQGSDRFYDEAIGMINLALSGYLDSATIYAWLKCKRYVLAGSYADVPRFESTYPASDDHQFHRKKNSLLGYHNFEEYVDVPTGRPKTTGTSSSFVELDEAHLAQAIYALMDRLLCESSIVLNDGVRAILRRFMRDGSFNQQLNLNFWNAFPGE